MDTGTHVAMGIALGGLATIDPVVAQNPALHQMVIIGTIIGSNAPDFDTILKLKNNASYLRHHRGITHSIPAILLWPLLITFGLYIFNPTINVFSIFGFGRFSLFFCTFSLIYLTVTEPKLCVHLIKNGSRLGLSILSTHLFFRCISSESVYGYLVTRLCLFCLDVHILIVYYVWRTYVRHLLVKQVKRKISNVEKVICFRHFNWSKWHIAVMTKDEFYVAQAKKLQLSILDVYKRKPIPNSPIMEAAKKDANVSAFLSFSPVYRWEVKQIKNGHEVRFIDLRYRSKGHYPFIAVVHLDHDLRITHSYTGWVYNTNRLKRRLKPQTNIN